MTKMVVYGLGKAVKAFTVWYSALHGRLSTGLKGNHDFYVTSIARLLSNRGLISKVRMLLSRSPSCSLHSEGQYDPN